MKNIGKGKDAVRSYNANKKRDNNNEDESINFSKKLRPSTQHEETLEMNQETQLNEIQEQQEHYEQFINGDVDIHGQAEITDSSDELNLDYEYSSTVKLQNPTFNMKSTSLYYADKLQHFWEVGVRETKDYLYEGSRIPIASFARGFSKLLDDIQVPENSHSKLLNFMHNSFGDVVNLPLSFIKNKEKKVEFRSDDSSDDENSLDSFDTDDLNDNETVAVANLTKFANEPPRVIGFDQCVNDCCVFAGSQNTKEFTCPKCSHPRFQPCSRSSCYGQSSTVCKHLLDDGVAIKKLWYRPILMLILDLLKTPHFLTVLNYERKRLNGDDEFYSDLLDGAIPQRHLKEMRAKFRNYELKDSSAHGNIISVTLLFSEFYDGVQLFKRKYANFWPLCISIMNLPPACRGKIGIGLFLMALYSGKHVNAEQFLMVDCFCEELCMLHDGIERTINGQRYFIQARLIYHILDTKAAEPILAVQSWSNARNACALCRLISGTHNSVKTCFFGHRRLLPSNHYLRYFGQSGKCCPTGFYCPESKHSWFSETFVSHDRPITLLQQLREVKNKQFPRGRMELCTPCEGPEETAATILKFMSSDTEEYEWNHKGLFRFDDFVNKESEKPNQTLKSLKSFLFYRHFDLREFKQYSRITSLQHLADAMKARDLNKNWVKGTKKNVHGIQDVWAFDRLPYSDIATQVDWPVVHAITGIEGLFNRLLFGEEKLSEAKNKAKPKEKNIKDLNEKSCKSKISNNSTEEELKPKMSIPPYRPEESPWEASSDDKNKCRAWLSCLLFPSGLNDDSWDLRSIISSKNELQRTKMNQKLKVYTCFMGVIMYNFRTVPDPFHWFFLMFANDFARLQQNMILKEDVVQLSNDIIETVCLTEGLFPSGVCTSQMHQLIHLAPMIYNFGPPIGISEFPGERAVGNVKRRKTKGNTGGRSFDKRIFIKQTDKELRILRGFYKQAVSADPKAMNNERCFKLYPDGRLFYNSRPFGMGKRESASVSKRNYNKRFTDHELEGFLSALLKEVRKYDDEKDLQKSSTFHRLHCLFTLRYKRTYSFSSWVKAVAADTLIVDDADLISLTKQLVQTDIVYFKNAFIYGLKMRGRGSNFRETIPPTKDALKKYHGTFTDIRDFWSQKVHYSSWCKFSQKETNKDQYYYGIINAFTQVTLNDTLLNQIMLASISAMKFTTTNKPHCLELVDVDAFCPNTMFVVLSDILPTSVATIPLDDTQLPMATRRTLIPIDLTAKQITFYSKHLTQNDYKLNKFVMILLHPEKLSMKPANTAFQQFLFEE